MLDRITKEEVKTIINSYKKDINKFECGNQHYVEACGLYCPATGKWSIDMSGRLNSACTPECKYYIKSGMQIHAEKMVALFDQIKIDTINKVIKYIEENPTCNNGDIMMMLHAEKERSYVEETTT